MDFFLIHHQCHVKALHKICTVLFFNVVLHQLSVRIFNFCFIDAVGLDSSLYIVPALHIVDKKQKIDCKWSLTDVTAFPKSSNLPNLPTCCVWWQTLESNQNALIGFDTGQILVVSLTDGRVLGGCHVTEPVVKLYISVDNVKDIVSLLVRRRYLHKRNEICLFLVWQITCKSGKEWQLILEHHSNGYTWPVETTNVNPDDSMKAKFYNLKQLGVDKLVSLRQVRLLAINPVKLFQFFVGKDQRLERTAKLTRLMSRRSTLSCICQCLIPRVSQKLSYWASRLPI